MILFFKKKHTPNLHHVEVHAKEKSKLIQKSFFCIFTSWACFICRVISFDNSVKISGILVGYQVDTLYTSLERIKKKNEEIFLMMDYLRK
jgi:hypothetical protein